MIFDFGAIKKLLLFVSEKHMMNELKSAENKLFNGEIK